MNQSARQHSDAESALRALTDIYDRSVARLREAFAAYVRGDRFTERVRACYPAIRLVAAQPRDIDPRAAYGFPAEPGVYSTTVTRPDLFGPYLREQIALLLENTSGIVEIGESDVPIPIQFALGEDFHVEQGLEPKDVARIPQVFDVPDLSTIDDRIANGVDVVYPDGSKPLSLFSGPRIDFSLLRLRHYTGTSPHHFQNFIIFTNYQFYIDEFVRLARDLLNGRPIGNLDPHERYTSLVEPGNVIGVPDGAAPQSGYPGVPPPRMPQMPAYHLKRADNDGITMINIGVGPSNAKNITDHVAVLRPHVWLMLGHCAGLRNTQALGDYVLAHAYLRQDQVLDADLPRDVPLPALAEIQIALERALERVTGLSGYDLKRIMRTGTVATVDDRNWELRPSAIRNLPFIQSRAIALDMESGTIAANGFRFRVPYGTLLCVSDKPLHGQLKLPGMADSFYRRRVSQHLQVGIEAMARLREWDRLQLHSRKLRSFNEVAFQ
ncbi:MAG: AMP nucleosidase [Pseudorhodoplanes sp.]|nr:AMP nucleosidase [Pseudorhodoplanes sp.]